MGLGGTIVAAGTSTPEFAVSLVAIRRGSLGVSVGNVIGSNIYNITGILGVCALIRPLVVSGTALETLAWLAAISALVVAALWTGRAGSSPGSKVRSLPRPRSVGGYWASSA